MAEEKDMTNTGRTHFKKGHIPWNKNLTKETDERLADTSKRMKENSPMKNPKIAEIVSKKLKGRHISPETEFQKGIRKPEIYERRKCGCGCGGNVSGWNYDLNKPIFYLPGHSNKTEKGRKLLRKKALRQFINGMPEGTKKKLKDFNRGKHHSKKTEFKKGKRGTLIEQYGEEKAKEIKKRMVKTRRTKGNYFHTEKTKKRLSEANTGELASNWQGGLSFEPYNKSFNNKFKREIRKRDNQVCMLCGIHREKLPRALCVHHINQNKNISIPQNCISLCLHCHMDIVHNNDQNKEKKENWIKFFQSLLSERYDYKYSETGEIILELNNMGGNNGKKN